MVIFFFVVYLNFWFVIRYICGFVSYNVVLLNQEFRLTCAVSRMANLQVLVDSIVTLSSSND